MKPRTRNDERAAAPAGCIACFHSISESAHDELRFSAQTFEELCRYWQDHFDMVALDALFSAAAADEGQSHSLLAITFDDGYADNAEVAAPILYRLGLSATFFIVTGCLDGEVEPHWYGEKRPPRMMNWQQAKELEKAGFSLGSHTHSHARLSTLRPELRTAELERPLLRLRQELLAPSLDFAFPFGQPQDCRDIDRAAIRAAGYRSAFACHGGVYASGDDRYHLNRMAISPRYHASQRDWQRAWQAETARWHSNARRMAGVQ